MLNYYVKLELNYFFFLVIDAVVLLVVYFMLVYPNMCLRK
jgi:hypothetical protein